MKDKFPVSIPELLAFGGWSGLFYTLVTAVGISDFFAATVAVLAFVGIVIYSSIQRLWTFEGSRFQLTDFKKGQVAYKNFENAERSIFVTHFTSALPEDVYIAKMLQMMENGVTVTRLLPPRALSQEWLKRFDGHQRYKQFIAKDDELPFDFLIVDGERLVFALPTHPYDAEFGRAWIMNNKEVASIFLGIFEKLRNGREPKPTGRA